MQITTNTFKPGQRVESTLVSGDFGTVLRQYPEGAVDVKWDDGTLCVVGRDEVR